MTLKQAKCLGAESVISDSLSPHAQLQHFTDMRLTIRHLTQTLFA